MRASALSNAAQQSGWTVTSPEGENIMKKWAYRITSALESLYIRLTVKPLVIEISESSPDGLDYYPYFWEK